MQDIWQSTINELLAVLSPHGLAADGVTKAYSLNDFSIHFFLQMAIIILACRVVGFLGKKFLMQPQVVGEMIAGVILGPSIFGLFFPEIQATIFPKEMKNILYTGAQFGVGLYMFLVGCQFSTSHFASKGKSAMAVSFAGITVPFILAILVTPSLLQMDGFFTDKVTLTQATLFFGACIALTAFPMLARIITERGLSQSSLGTLSLTAGAFDDAVSWCVLALVLASFGAGPGVAVLAIGGGLAYTAFLLIFGRKLLAPLGRMVEKKGQMSELVLSITMICFFLSAFIMDAVGIHAIFGGFIMGVVMPRGKFTEELKKKVEPFAVIVLLPMFFTFSGLNTNFAMVNSLSLLLAALGILAISILAKFGACYVAARLSGEDNATSLGIGALMNSRGLMELIIINIGLQKGIIEMPLFAIMVLMAIVTTVMATPLFEWVYGKKARESGLLGPTSDP